MPTEEHCDAVIEDHVVFSMAASTIPIPRVDLGAIAAVQLDLIKELAELHRVEYDAESGKAIVSSLTGASLARIGAGAGKETPDAGGGAAEAIVSGASTYALGRVFRGHVGQRRRLEDLDPEQLRSLYQNALTEGRRVAASLCKRATAQRHDACGKVEAISRLHSLREAQAISAEEYERLKVEVVQEAKAGRNDAGRGARPI